MLTPSCAKRHVKSTSQKIGQTNHIVITQLR